MNQQTPIIPLSQIIIQNHDVVTFAGLLEVVNAMGEQGMILMEFDLKPDFPDTPRDWQMKLELAFTTKKSPFAKRREEIAAKQKQTDGNKD